MKKLVMAVGCALMLASMASMAAGAEVYKWKDAKGKTQYSDVPPVGNIPYTTLSGNKPASAPGSESQKVDAPAAPASPAAGVGAAKPGEAKPDAGKPPADPKAADAAAQKKALEEKAAKDAEVKKLQQEKLAAEKKANCKKALSDKATFEQGGRIYEVDEKGERHYIGNKEMADRLEQAKSDVATYCE
jgi:Domain of unknown function (DUF4124)